MSDSTHHSHKKFYIIIFFALAALTGLELWIPELENATKVFKTSSLILLAVGKAFMVAYFYMHLNEEKAWLKFIAAIPISAAIYAAVVILESIYR